MLSVRNLTKAYNGFRGRCVLQGISLELAAGEYIAIMGESGAGKSTLLNLIAGLDTPDAGEIWVGGENIASMDDACRTKLRRARMGFAFQSSHLLPHLSVAQNVALPLALNNVAVSERAGRVQGMLDAVGLGDRGDSYPRELSGGQMQRIALARALIHNPRLLLADEPTGNLDQGSASEMLALLRRQVEECGCTAILVTHSATAAASADRTYVLAGGVLRPLPSPLM